MDPLSRLRSRLERSFQLEQREVQLLSSLDRKQRATETDLERAKELIEALESNLKAFSAVFRQLPKTKSLTELSASREHSQLLTQLQEAGVHLRNTHQELRKLVKHIKKESFVGFQIARDMVLVDKKVSRLLRQSSHLLP